MAQAPVEFAPAQLQPPSRKHETSLIEAGFAQCRFIVREAPEGAICCGAPTTGGSWCPWHRRIVYETRAEAAARAAARAAKAA